MFANPSVKNNGGPRSQSTRFGGNNARRPLAIDMSTAGNSVLIGALQGPLQNWILVSAWLAKFLTKHAPKTKRITAPSGGEIL
jgi:hypothetical protein